MKFEVHIHIHKHGVGSADSILTSLMHQLLANQQQLAEDIGGINDLIGGLMALSVESKKLLADINEDTNQIAAVIQRLLENPDTTEEEFREALQPIADHLDLLAKDPAAPIPPPVAI